MQGIEGDTAIVTGSGSGIGREIASRLAEEGATVIVTDIDEDGANETVNRIQNDGGSAEVILADASDFDEAQAMFDQAVEEHDGVDILVNNVGWDRMNWFIEQGPEDWQKLISLNFMTTVNCSWAAASHFTEEEKAGKIVNIASDSGRVGTMGEAVYSGCKGGVISFTKTLARELSRYQVNCNAVAPGPTDTPFAERQKETDVGAKLTENMVDFIPFGRMAEPEEIAAAVAFLSSDDASFITGQVLSVNGGLNMAD